jgi:hypothetical protein
VTAFTGTIPTIASGDTTTVPTNFATWRDCMKGLSEAWTAYTPTWTAVTANPALGNGSFSGSAYARVNKLVMFRIVLTMGSTTTYGTGQWIFTPPVAAVAPNTNRVPFAADLYDAGVNAYAGVATFFTAGNLYLYCDPTTAGNPLRGVTSAIPFAWGTGDQVVITGTYEAA